jgi:hypothetical protein
MVEKIIDRIESGEYDTPNGSALVKLDLQELAEYVAELVDTIENLEIKLEEANEEKQPYYLEKAVNCKGYQIDFYYEEKGVTTVKADTSDEAVGMVMAELEEYGLERIDYKTNDRDYGVMKVEV